MGHTHRFQTSTRRMRAKQALPPQRGLVPSESQLPEEAEGLFPEDGPPPDRRSPLADEAPAQKTSEGRLVRIALLDGSPQRALSGGVIQYVNLPREQRFVDGQRISSIDRLGPQPRVLIEFSEPGTYTFTLHLSPAPRGNATYSEREKRHRAFDPPLDPRSYQTASDGTAVVDDLAIGIAGGDRFKIVAEHEGEERSSGIIEARRLLWIKPCFMEGDAEVNRPSSAAPFTSTFKDLGLDLALLPKAFIPRQPNIGDEEAAKRMGMAVLGQMPADLDPYVVGLAFVEHLGVRWPDMPVAPVQITGGGPAPETVTLVGESNGLTRVHHLWRDLGEGGMKTKGGFFKYLDGDGTTRMAEVPPEAITPASPEGVCNQVLVDVSTLPERTGTLRIFVDTVHRFRAGISFYPRRVICTATLAFWRPTGDTTQNLNAIHEYGHQLGLASDGKGHLDQVPNHYDDSRGHVGNHCHAGLPAGLPNYEDPDLLAQAACIMFGSSRPGSFCPDCAASVRKQDLSRGLH